MHPGPTLRESLTGVNVWLAQWFSGLWQGRDIMEKQVGKENVFTLCGQEEEKDRQEGDGTRCTLQRCLYLALLLPTKPHLLVAKWISPLTAQSSLNCIASWEPVFL